MLHVHHPMCSHVSLFLLMVYLCLFVFSGWWVVGVKYPNYLKGTKFSWSFDKLFFQCSVIEGTWNIVLLLMQNYPYLQNLFCFIVEFKFMRHWLVCVAITLPICLAACLVEVHRYYWFQLLSNVSFLNFTYFRLPELQQLVVFPLLTLQLKPNVHQKWLGQWALRYLFARCQDR